MDEAMRRAFWEDGAVLAKGVLNKEDLARCREALDWIIEHPGPHSSRMYKGTPWESHVDNSNPHAKARMDELAASLPLGRLFADLWGSEHVWYFAEEVFHKAGGRGGPTQWHQDTSYLPWGGMHWSNAWISFEPVPKPNGLGVVRGSHRGTRYDGPTFKDPDNPTMPLHGGDALPRLPDIEADLKRDPKSWDILSWATEPGDVVLLHPNSLHGGAPVDASFPERHTLVLRFFGDDAHFHPLPEHSNAGFPQGGILFTEEMSKLKAGDPFRSPVFRQVV